MKHLLFLFLVLSTSIFSQQLYEKILYPYDGLNIDYYGRRIAVHENMLFVSSIRYQNTIDGAVYFYLFEDNEYKFVSKIYPDDPEMHALFGSNLLFKDNQLFVGAQNKKVNNMKVGALYVFEQENDNWVQKQKILPPEPHSFRSVFSNQAAKHNDILLIGATDVDSVFENTGIAYLYEYVNNHYVYKKDFFPHDPKEYQGFGASLILKDDLIIIGSIDDSTSSGIGSGSIYVYTKQDSNWIFQQKYFPEPNSDHLSFGCDLAINDDYLFVGTSDNTDYNKPGQVYIYKIEGLSLHFVQKINSGENYIDDHFGISLIASSDSLLVSAVFDTVKNNNCGSVYLFENDNGYWNKVRKIVPSNEQKAHFYGSCVELTKDKIFVGAHDTELNGKFTGAVYIYTEQPLTHVQENEITPSDFVLSQNYPNPFNPTTKIKFTVPVADALNASPTVIKIYDVLGNELETLLDEAKLPGTYEIEFDGRKYTSGTYFYKITCSGYSETRKMVMMK